MAHTQTSSNPFALLMHPETVVAAMERSERLGHLNRRVCRPLDKPLIPHAADDAAVFDDEIEKEPESDA
jgi:hypothetical protein